MKDSSSSASAAAATKRGHKGRTSSPAVARGHLCSTLTASVCHVHSILTYQMVTAAANSEMKEVSGQEQSVTHGGFALVFQDIFYCLCGAEYWKFL